MLNTAYAYLKSVSELRCSRHVKSCTCSACSQRSTNLPSGWTPNGLPRRAPTARREGYVERRADWATLSERGVSAPAYTRPDVASAVQGVYRHTGHIPRSLHSTRASRCTVSIQTLVLRPPSPVPRSSVLYLPH